LESPFHNNIPLDQVGEVVLTSNGNAVLLQVGDNYPLNRYKRNEMLSLMQGNHSCYESPDPYLERAVEAQNLLSEDVPCHDISAGLNKHMQG
jgi:hypothetical protein